MMYLAGEIWIYLIAALIIGFFVGWTSASRRA